MDPEKSLKKIIYSFMFYESSLSFDIFFAVLYLTCYVVILVK